MKLLKHTALLLAIMGMMATCKKSSDDSNDENTNPPPVGYHPDDQPPTDDMIPTVNILWDADARKVSHDIYFADYGRIHRAANGDLILTYGSGPNAENTRTDVVVRRSTDNGATWSDAVTVMSGIGLADYTGFANPEILVMQNGWLMLAFGGKGRPDDNEHDNVQVLISKDNGLTWGDRKIISRGRYWEPAMIQLPNGEIEVFWSSEAKWWPSNDVQQEILMSRSKDNGNTWTMPITVAYTPGMRDGMPTPLILKDNKGLVFTIESIDNSKSPYVIWSSMDALWNYSAPGSTTNKRRWLATADNVFGAAPHIIQLNTGETLVSFQANDGRAVDDWRRATMLVYRGNSMAGACRRINDPWPDLPVDVGAYYSSMFLKENNRIVLVTTRYMPDRHSEVWLKEGRLVHNYLKTNWRVTEVSSEDPVNNRSGSKLIDHDITTFWITRYSTNPTNYPDHYATIDMGVKQDVDGFSLVQKTTDRKIKILEILISDNGSNWQSLGEFTLRNKDLTEQLLPLPSRASFRYFKIVPKVGYDSQKQPGLAEVGAYTLD